MADKESLPQNFHVEISAMNWILKILAKNIKIDWQEKRNYRIRKLSLPKKKTYFYIKIIYY